jgi:hypothetical protein
MNSTPDSEKLRLELKENFSGVLRRIDSFEELRKERTAENANLDTDKDGISDIDEIRLYQTNPQVADTDEDGLPDALEIMRGVSPVDTSPGAVIVFQSPKDSIGLSRADVLEIKEVTPLVREETPEMKSTVAAEIRGKALPNSLVTLYIFSTPTVVTVKTDADGTFVYTFDKELEDGQHDVYVTVTDTAGDILAQSNPFSFIKVAQAFTPVNAAGDEVISPEPIAESTGGGYSLAIGVGILAFGFILLVLGISLRKGDVDEIIITEKPVSDPNSKQTNDL